MGHVILVTGGQRGIGACIAQQSRAMHWDVLAPSREVCDVLDVDSVTRYVSWLHQSVPTLHAVVLNAHAWCSKPCADLRLTDFETQWRYVTSHWLLLRALLAHYALECVVAVSSVRGLIGGVESAPYAMAKAALIALMQGYAREYTARPTRFHVVCPGWTDTTMGLEVKRTGGVSNPDAVAQDPNVVAQHVCHLLRAPVSGYVVRINQGIATRMAWQEQPDDL